MGRLLKTHLGGWKQGQAVGGWKGPAFFPRGRKREQGTSTTRVNHYPGLLGRDELVWVMASMTCLWNGACISE